MAEVGSDAVGWMAEHCQHVGWAGCPDCHQWFVIAVIAGWPYATNSIACCVELFCILIIYVLFLFILLLCTFFFYCQISLYRIYHSYTLCVFITMYFSLMFIIKTSSLVCIFLKIPLIVCFNCYYF